MEISSVGVCKSSDVVDPGNLLTGLNLALYIAARDTVLLALSVSNAPLYFPFLFWF